MNRLIVAAAAALFASPVVAQTAPVGSDQSAFEQATAAGVCGDAGVATAIFVNPGEISVTCLEDATAVVPLLGGLAPFLLGGAAAVALAATAAGDGGTTPDTQ